MPSGCSSAPVELLHLCVPSTEAPYRIQHTGPKFSNRLTPYQGIKTQGYNSWYIKNNRLQIRSRKGGAINLGVKGLNLRFASPMGGVWWVGQQGHNALKRTCSNAT